MSSHPQLSCWQCRHLIYSLAWCGTDITPGDAFELSCAKKHWKFDPQESTVGDFRRSMSAAETCADFLDFKMDRAPWMIARVEFDRLSPKERWFRRGA